jgi:hypothetical protein
MPHTALLITHASTNVALHVHAVEGIRFQAQVCRRAVLHSRMRMFRGRICFVDFFPTYLALLADGYRASIPGVCKQQHFVSRCVVEVFASQSGLALQLGSLAAALFQISQAPPSQQSTVIKTITACARVTAPRGCQSLSTLCPSEFMRRPAALPCDARRTRTCCAWSQRPF